MFNKVISLLAEAGHTVEHAVEELPVETQNLEGDISSWSLRVVVASALLLLALAGVAILTNGKTKKLKLPLFIAMSFIMVSSTLMLAASTIYLNVVSDSGGPVHWHADLEYWVCDNEIEPIDPTGFSNKVGSGSVHEHNDGRLHIEGVVVDAEIDASLGRYMDIVGSELTDTTLVIPVNFEGSVFAKEIDGDGPANSYPGAVNDLITTKNGVRYVDTANGLTCSGEPAQVQVFVYKFNKTDNTYEQTKLENPASYTLSPEALVPPGDCIIIEFGPLKEKTFRLCEEYGTRDVVRCVEFGVNPERTDLCDIEQINYTPIGTGADPNADLRVDDEQTDEHVDDHDDGGVH